jgi:alkaline phosphatase
MTQKIIRTVLGGTFCSLLFCQAIAQSVQYTTSNGHAHNDYDYNIPFLQAQRQGFGSIEADVFLIRDTLFVSHDSNRIQRDVLFDNAYLVPLAKTVAKNNGYPFADQNKKLQLLIDIKTAYPSTISAVVNAIQKHPTLTNNPAVTFVITGNQPAVDSFKHYPSFIYFDGNLNKPDHAINQDKIALYSAEFKKYSKWNGKGLIPAAELALVNAEIAKAHKLGKPFRFWGCPDNVNTWYTFTKLGVDYINTDRVEAFSDFVKTLKKSTSVSTTTNTQYTPTYRVDGDNTRVKNVILIIGDGTGLAQWYAGYTGNKGKLNVFNMRSIGLSKTSSADSYITDSGAGASAMATGQKTNNRFISVSPQDKPTQSLPELLTSLHKSTAVISTGDITDATPAAFYSHVNERSLSEKIAAAFLQSKVDILIGGSIEYFNNRKDKRDLINEMSAKQYTVIDNINNLDTVKNKKLVLLDSTAELRASENRGPFLTKSLEFSINKLKENKAGFFIMAEGAQVDHGGHDNELNWLVQEVKDLDNAIGAAMRFADQDGETLVVVTADHETGGLSLLSGDIASGTVSGHFSSDDHSAICVPVFAYGPQSRLFCGVYENTEIFDKIMKAFAAIKKAGK